MGIKIIKTAKGIKKDSLPLVIGYFGCIHIMHQQLLTKYHDFNVLTFNDLVSKRSHQIYNYKSRLQNLEKYNPKTIYVLDVSNTNLKGIDFINRILKPLNPSEILVGEDFKFGSDNRNIRFLKDYFKVNQLNYNPNISTQHVYDLIVKGELEKANDYMSFNLYFVGKWILGDRQGRTIGFPTINMKNKRPFMLKEGSYITLTTIRNKRYKSISFVGKSKIIRRHSYPIIETHILDAKIKPRFFYLPSVRNSVKVEFLKFIRPNLKLKSLQELKPYLEKDKEEAKKYFKQLGI